jgi:hypothetical protein
MRKDHPSLAVLRAQIIGAIAALLALGLGAWLAQIHGFTQPAMINGGML